MPARWMAARCCSGSALPIRPSPHSIRRRSAAGPPSSPTALTPWAPPAGGHAPTASSALSRAATLAGPSTATRSPSRSRTLSITSRPAISKFRTQRRPTRLPPRASPIGRPISTWICPSSTRATTTRTAISCGRPTLSRACPARTPPRRAYGRSTATTAQARSSVPKTPRPESPNTRAR